MKINGVEIIQDFIPKSNKTSRPGYYMNPKYITIHNTGNSKKGADADMHTEYVDTATGYVSWHYTVDDKKIFQELPDNETAWHAGDGNGTGNMTSIGIEVCENIDGDYAKSEENAIKLIVYLMNKHNIPLKNVVPHQKWSGKYCPRVILPYWDEFILRIKSKHDEVYNTKKGEDDKLELKHDWQWKMLEDTLHSLYKKGILNSVDWVERVKSKELTVSELTWINTIIIDRSIK